MNSITLDFGFVYFSAVVLSVVALVISLFVARGNLHKFWQGYLLVPLLLCVSYYLDKDSFGAWLANFILMGAKAFTACLMLYAVQRIYLGVRSSKIADEKHRQNVQIAVLVGFGFVVAGSMIN